MAEMGFAGDAVVLAKAGTNYEYLVGETTHFRTSFKIVDVLRGRLSVGEEFELQSLRIKSGDIERIIDGDIQFEAGKTYLLFLVESDYEPYWQPMMLSYGIHVEEQLNGNAYLVPSEGTLEMNVLQTVDGLTPEPPTVYPATNLVNHLKSVFNNVENWNYKAVASEIPPNTFFPELDVAPSHCAFLTISGQGFRWQGFPDQVVNVWSEDNGDPDFSPASVHSSIPTILNTLQTNYTGINLNYSGTRDFTPNCVNGDAVDGNFTSFMNGLGRRNMLIQYNDPCNQITNLSNCAGTLAIGGSYVSGTHTYDGQTWRSQLWGYVVMNNGVRACFSTATYEIILTHELTHALGVGHIASNNGAANMNPSCCSGITDLDRACLNFSYPPSDVCVTPLAVNQDPIPANTYQSSGELTSTGRVAGGTSVTFQAANSITLGTNFIAEATSDFVATIQDCDNFQSESFAESSSYHFQNGSDFLPQDVKDLGLNIIPNPVNQEAKIVFNLYEISEVEAALLDVNGQLIRYIQPASSFNEGYNELFLNTANLNAGMYYVVMQSNNLVETKKMVVIHR